MLEERVELSCLLIVQPPPRPLGGLPPSPKAPLAGSSREPAVCAENRSVSVLLKVQGHGHRGRADLNDTQLPGQLPRRWSGMQQRPSKGREAWGQRGHHREAWPSTPTHRPMRQSRDSTFSRTHLAPPRVPKEGNDEHTPNPTWLPEPPPLSSANAVTTT